jgi:hypothetical protein
MIHSLGRSEETNWKSAVAGISTDTDDRKLPLEGWMRFLYVSRLHISIKLYRNDVPTRLVLYQTGQSQKASLLTKAQLLLQEKSSSIAEATG